MKNQLADESHDYENLKKEMKGSILKLKEKLSEAKSECELALNYRRKINKTKVDTTIRINNQTRKNIELEKKKVVEAKTTEEDVFDKIKGYLGVETSDLNKKIDNWGVRVFVNHFLEKIGQEQRRD